MGVKGHTVPMFAYKIQPLEKPLEPLEKTLEVYDIVSCTSFLFLLLHRQRTETGFDGAL